LGFLVGGGGNNMSGKTIRVMYRKIKGRVNKKVNWEAVSQDSAVSITATKMIPDPRFGGDVDMPVASDQDVFVTNVFTFGDGGFGSGVEFCLHVDGTRVADVMVTITHVGDYVRVPRGLWGIAEGDISTVVVVPKS
jgi:hypothetical protein